MFIFSLFLSVQSIIMIQTVSGRAETEPPPVELLLETGFWNELVVDSTCHDCDFFIYLFIYFIIFVWSFFPGK